MPSTEERGRGLTKSGRGEETQGGVRTQVLQRMSHDYPYHTHPLLDLHRLVRIPSLKVIHRFSGPNKKDHVTAPAGHCCVRQQSLPHRIEILLRVTIQPSYQQPGSQPSEAILLLPDASCSHGPDKVAYHSRLGCYFLLVLDRLAASPDQIMRHLLKVARTARKHSGVCRLWSFRAEHVGLLDTGKCWGGRRDLRVAGLTAGKELRATAADQRDSHMVALRERSKESSLTVCPDPRTIRHGPKPNLNPNPKGTDPTPTQSNPTRT